MNLQHKIVFITGSSSGIGEEMAYAFAKEHAAVIATYHTNKAAGEKVIETCRKMGAPFTLLVQLDLMDNASITHAVAKVVEHFGGIDILINNAGVMSWKNLKEQPFEEIEMQIRTNLEGMIKITKAAIPHITSAIINVASLAGESALPNLSTYCASKFGVRGFTQAIAKEYPELNIFSLCPGMTATAMTGYMGVEPSRVADVVIKAVQDKMHVPQGGDLDAWEILDQRPETSPHTVAM